MGKVKIDVNSGEVPYKGLTLSDINVVKWLIQFRDQTDPYFQAKTNNDPNKAGNVKPLNQELVSLYADLDVLINKCDFNVIQLKIIKLLSEGHNYEQIHKIMNYSSPHGMQKRFEKICKDIVKMNDWDWRKKMLLHELKLIPKQCNKCKDDLPATDEFFGNDTRNKDSFQSICRKCDNYRKKRGD